MALRLMRSTARLSSQITYVTENLRIKYEEPHSASMVLPNGVDIQMFRPEQRKPSPFTVGFVGALRQWVDLKPVFEAVQHLNQAGTDVRVLVVGDEGGLMDTLVLATNKYRLGDKIECTGVVPFIKVPEYINAMDVVVFPFTFDNPMPLAALQAMACGKPIISTRPLEINCGAIRYSPDAGSYRRRLEDLIAHPDVGQRMGAEGRSYVIQHHDWAKITERMERIIESRRPHD